MFNLKAYDVPIDLIAYEFLRFVSYFDLDHILPCFRLTPKEIAQIKYKIYKQRLKIMCLTDRTFYIVEYKMHREDGPAVEWLDGSINHWYLNNKRHRVDGPAIEYIIGYKAWYIDDKLHRTDGPAIIKADGYKEWWLNGERVPEF